MAGHRLLTFTVLFLAAATPVRAQIADGATKADAERALQAYLAVWSSEERFKPATVTRFYAPHVVYYGKSFSRAQVLGDKEAYLRQWPIRHYRVVPGSFTATCDPAKTLCKVTADMVWHRVSRTGQVSDGRARLTFDFIPVEGGRKIAREAAHLL